MMPEIYPAVYIALPVLNEFANLPVLIENIVNQDYRGVIRLFICVNQPETWWHDPEKIEICHDNAQSLSYLSNCNHPLITVIDRSSKGRGWVGRQHGVGYARREVMEAISGEANENDIIVSLDADTTFGKSYLSSVVKTLLNNSGAAALAVPYYHYLTGDSRTDLAILRYEIYMRHFAINLFRISSPYAFTALGSAIALTVKNYRSIGGITPKLSGEDFYFLQKLRKKGKILTWNPEKVYPAARFSSRVYFGTGPAMIKGAAGDWSSYPIYHHTWFDMVKSTYDLFPQLFRREIVTPMDNFLSEIFPQENIWEKLRKNAASPEKFIWACHQKLDGLRLLQYLKWRHRQHLTNDEDNLVSFLQCYYPDAGVLNDLINSEDFSFRDTGIELLNQLRNFLVKTEDEFLKAR